MLCVPLRISTTHCRLTLLRSRFALGGTGMVLIVLWAVHALAFPGPGVRASEGRGSQMRKLVIVLGGVVILVGGQLRDLPEATTGRPRTGGAAGAGAGGSAIAHAGRLHGAAIQGRRTTRFGSVDRKRSRTAAWCSTSTTAASASSRDSMTARPLGPGEVAIRYRVRDRNRSSRPMRSFFRKGTPMRTRARGSANSVCHLRGTPF